MQHVNNGKGEFAKMGSRFFINLP